MPRLPAKAIPPTSRRGPMGGTRRPTFNGVSADCPHLGLGAHSGTLPPGASLIAAQLVDAAPPPVPQTIYQPAGLPLEPIDPATVQGLEAVRRR
jgi:hypothetical protein